MMPINQEEYDAQRVIKWKLLDGVKTVLILLMFVLPLCIVHNGTHQYIHYLDQGPTEMPQSIQQILSKYQANLVSTLKYKEDRLNKQLSFCILLQDVDFQNGIYQSILKQNYTNYKIILFISTSNKRWKKKNRMKLQQKLGIKINYILSGFYDFYQRYHKFLIKGDMCEQTDILYSPYSQLSPNQLTKIQQLYQGNQVWAVYSKIRNEQGTSYHLKSFYAHLLRYFDKEFAPSPSILSVPQPYVQLELFLSMFQLCGSRIMKQQYRLNKERKKMNDDRILFTQVYKMNEYVKNRTQRQQLSSLSDIDPITDKYKQQIPQTETLKYQRYLSLPYLNTNHTLILSEKIKFLQQYPSRGRSLQCQPKKPQLPNICLVVYCFNNEKQMRVPSFLLSIHNQISKDFLVVFVDDSSEDHSLYFLKKLFTTKHYNLNKLIVSNPKHLGVLGSVQFILENGVCQSAKSLFVMKVTDILFGNSVIDLVSETLQKDNGILAASFQAIQRSSFKRLNSFSVYGIDFLRKSSLISHTIEHFTSQGIDLSTEMEQVVFGSLSKFFGRQYNSRVVSIEQPVIFFGSSGTSQDYQALQRSLLSQGKDLQKKLANINSLSQQNSDIYKEGWEDRGNYDLFTDQSLGSRDHQQRVKLNYSAFESEKQIEQFIFAQVMEKQEANFLNIEPKHKIMFSVRLWENRYVPKYQQAEFFYFDQFYRISEEREQKQICIIGSHYNMLKQRDYRAFLESVALQNYTNYRLVLIDDASTDGTDRLLRKLIEEQFPVLKSKIYFVRQHQPLGSLKTRAQPSKYCAGSEILIDVDSDDILPGAQILNIVNSLYQSDQSAWLIYFNFIYTSDLRTYKEGYTKQINLLPNRFYRHELDYWVTGHLKTMLTKLYLKVFEVEEVDFKKRACDRHVLYTALELAGLERVRFLEEFFYIYDLGLQSRCEELSQLKDEFYYRQNKVLNPISTLQQQPTFMESVQVPEEVIHQSLNIEFQLNKCEREKMISLTERSICESDLESFMQRVNFKNE